jgi:HlyD family secretion protein
VDVTESQFKLAQSQLTAAKLQYGLAREGAREEDIEAASSAVDRAGAAVNLARLQLEYARVKSPGELTVNEIYVEQGELAAPGTALVLLQDMNDFYIDLFVPIKRIAEVHAGDQVEIEVEGLAGRFLKGTVDAMHPRAEFTPENISTEEGRSHLVFKVRVKIKDPGHMLKPGVPADAWILSR